MARFYVTHAKKSLLDRVFEGLRSTELRDLHSLDLDGSASARIAAGAASTRLSLENAQASDGNLLAALQAIRDSADDRLDSALSISLCTAYRSVHFIPQVHFICHMVALVIDLINQTTDQSSTILSRILALSMVAVFMKSRYDSSS